MIGPLQDDREPHQSRDMRTDVLARRGRFIAVFCGCCFVESTTQDSGESADKGVWMSIWVDDVDAVHRHCLDQGLEVTMPPTNEPWGVREMHVRHPDGHVFRISQGAEVCAPETP